MTETPYEEPTRREQDPDAEPVPEGMPAGEPGFDTEPEPEEGHPLVEETMTRLAELRDRPVSEHAEIYADVHERLQTALAESDRSDIDPADADVAGGDRAGYA